jgi:hypothetical protein
MVMICNINYITSKEYNVIVEEDVSKKSKSKSVSDFGDDIKKKLGNVIGLFEKKQKQIGGFREEKGSHNKKYGELSNIENKSMNDEIPIGTFSIRAY